MKKIKINSKTKILVGILIVAIVLVCGLLIWNQINCKDICYGNKISPCEPMGFKCICVNMKFCSKNCGAECENDADCFDGKVCDKESCKCTQKQQELRKISEQEVLKIDISKPEQIGANRFKVIINISVLNYSFSKVNGFDLIDINGSDEIREDGYPILPKINIPVMLPLAANNVTLSMIDNASISIGSLNIPCFVASRRSISEMTNCAGLTETFPIPLYGLSISEFDEYKKVGISLALAQYNSQTNEIILYNYTKLELTYQTPITATIADFSPDKTEYVTGETINASLTVENVGSEALTGLRANLSLKDQYGEVRASSLSAPFDVASGESKTVYVTLSQNLPHGSYLAEIKVVNSTGYVLGSSSEDIFISSGGIVDFFLPSEVVSGEDITFNITFKNDNATDVEAIGVVHIYDPHDMKIAELHSAPTDIAANSTGMMNITWSTAGREIGIYI